jgi:uncharacterized protein YjlB
MCSDSPTMASFPNPKLPFIFYRSPVRVVRAADPAALFEVLFARNGWKDSWRYGIYDYAHFHSQIHEVIGIAHGEARDASAARWEGS